ncbi:MAG: hypothetical protein V1908_04120 [Candidatus Peregrinibacteria bacterium]
MFLKFFHSKQRGGLTFPEVMIYIALGALVLTGIISFSWRVIGSGVKVEVSTELTQESRLALERITQSIQAADGVTTGTFSSHPGTVTLDYPGTADIVIDTYTTTVTVGGQEVAIRKLRLREGAAAAVDLTSNRMNVTNFVITQLRRDAEVSSIRVSLTLQAVSTGQDPLYNRSLTLQTSASPRH